MKLLFIIFVLPLLIAKALASSETSYCITGSSLFFDTIKGPLLVELDKKMKLNDIIISEEISSHLKTQPNIVIYECQKDKLLIHAGDDSYEFQINENKTLTFLKSHADLKYRNLESLGTLTNDNRKELFVNEKFKVFLKVIHTKKRTPTNYGASIVHYYKNSLIKVDRKSGKKIEELLIFEGDREETADIIKR